MDLKILDTYQKSVVKIPLNKTIKIYSCGPTVYNYQHIGNIIAVFLPELIKNTIIYAGGEVVWCSNVTDLGHLVNDSDHGEDKIELKAKAEGSSPQAIADFYFSDFLEQLKLVNIDFPRGQLNPYATQYIYEQMYLALELVKLKRAYYATDGIYFDSQANQDLDTSFLPDTKGNTEYNDRKLVNTMKDPKDFALWKFVSIETLQKYRFTDYPELYKYFSIPEEYNILYGCPGWHSECVAMITAVLGFGQNYNSQNFSFTDFQKKESIIDIHTGGEDHINLHHKNEILQSLALGINLSKYWVHNKHLKVDNQRMSKSLGNVFTIKGEKKLTGFDSIVNKNYNPLAFRLMFFEHNYQEQINFKWEKLEQSQNRLYSLYKLAGALQAWKITSSEQNLILKKEFQELLLDNLKIREVLDLVQKSLNQQINLLNQKNSIDQNTVNTLIELDKTVLKLNIFEDINPNILELVSERTVAKKNKNFVKADQIRKGLLELNYQIDDYKWGSGLWKK